MKAGPPSLLSQLAATAQKARRQAIGGDLSAYDVGELLGKGGMGQVNLAHDPRIGRDVAIKRMRTVDPEPAAIERFLREARIQARLEHPAIVPVHEIGCDVDGAPYF